MTYIYIVDHNEEIMQTFLEYVIIKDFDRIIQEVNTEAENNPTLNAILLQEGFWSNLGNAAKNFAQGAWSGGGIKTGAQAAWSQMTGPETQYKTAMGALQKALTAIQKDPNWSKSTTTGSATLPAMNLAQWLTEIIKELDSQTKQFANKKVQTNQSSVTTAAQPSTGVPDTGSTKWPAPTTPTP